MVLALTFMGAFSNRPLHAKQESSLANRLQALWQEYQDPAVQAALWVQDLKSGQMWIEKNPDLALIPASNQKILLILMALEELGPNYRFPTRVLGQPPDAEGRSAQLILQGGGDPTLSTGDLQEIAGALRALGLRKVDQLRLDDSLFPMSSYPGQLSRNQIDAPFNAPVGALSVDQNLIHLVLRPGTQTGDPLSVSLDPPLKDFPLEIQATTGGKKPRLLVRNQRDGPKDEKIIIKGRLPLGAEAQKLSLAQAHPRQMVARRVKQAFNQWDIVLPEKLDWVIETQQAPLIYEHHSPPLQQILQMSGKESNNYVSEQILKVLAARQGHLPAKTSQGVALLKEWMTRVGLPVAEIQMENASGLSRENRLTVRVLAQALKRALEEPKIREEFLSSLSVLGVDGTLKDKFFDKGLEGHFRGKTGTLSGVSSLSGLVLPQARGSEGLIIVAYIANGSGKGFWRQLQFQQKLLELLIQTP